MKKFVSFLLIFVVSCSICTFFCFHAPMETAEASETYKLTVNDLGFEVTWKVDGEDNWWPIKDCVKITVTAESNVTIEVRVTFKQGNTTSTAQTANIGATVSYFQKFQSQWTNCSQANVEMWIRANGLVYYTGSLVLHY